MNNCSTRSQVDQLMIALTQPCLEAEVVQLLLQLRDGVGPRLAVLHHLGEEEGEGGQRDLLLAPRQRLVQDGRLGADHGRGRRRRHRHGDGGRGVGVGGRSIPDCPWRRRARCSSPSSRRRFTCLFPFKFSSSVSQFSSYGHGFTQIWMSLRKLIFQHTHPLIYFNLKRLIAPQIADSPSSPGPPVTEEA